MLHDPMRSQSRALAVGAIVAALGLAAMAVLALIRPQDKIGNNKIVVGKDSGAMFVVMNDNTLHPVLNLASARLVAGKADKPAIVKEAEIGKRSRGALVGIPGAPQALPFDKSGDGRQWSVCDSLDNGSPRNSVVVGDPVLGERAGALGSGEALLLKGTEGTYLVYGGTKAKVNPTDRAIASALALQGKTPRAVSPGLLNAIPEVPEIKAPQIDGAGGYPTYDLQGQRVGSVVLVNGEKPQYYVVLRNGVQRVSSATKDIIRFTNSVGQTDVPTITPDSINNVDIVEDLAVQTYPDTAPAVVDAGDKPVSCLNWKPITGGDKDKPTRGSELQVLVGRSLPISENAKTVKLAQSGEGIGADFAYIPPGTGAYLQSTGIEPDSQRRDSIYYVSDTGVRFGVKNKEAAEALGFQGIRPELAPWDIVKLLAAGPALGKEEAMVAHDGIAPDANPAALPSGS